jgi:hypothetical protein
MPTLNLKPTPKAVSACYYSLARSGKLFIKHEIAAVYAARLERSNQQNKRL